VFAILLVVFVAAILAVPGVLSGMAAGMMQNVMASAGSHGCELVDA
jgi:hypothetical protein